MTQDLNHHHHHARRIPNISGRLCMRPQGRKRSYQRPSPPLLSSMPGQEVSTPKTIDYSEPATVLVQRHPSYSFILHLSIAFTGLRYCCSIVRLSDYLGLMQSEKYKIILPADDLSVVHSGALGTVLSSMIANHATRHDHGCGTINVTSNQSCWWMRCRVKPSKYYD
jgi:hypothetical protein